MSNVDSVGQNTAVSFGNYAIAAVSTVSLTSTGNAVVSIPILTGGLTTGTSVASSGGVIVRRITVQNPSGNVSTGNITIFTSNDGNTSNAVTTAAGTTLTSMTGTGTWQDLTIIAPFLANVVSGYNTQSFYVKVVTAVANATVDIRVYGDTVNF
jgi:hypothetical protein